MDRERAGPQGLTTAELPHRLSLGRRAQSSRLPYPFCFLACFRALDVLAALPG